MKNQALLFTLFLVFFFSSCNNMLLDSAYRQIEGEWVRSDSDIENVTTTLTFNTSDKTFTWSDMILDQQRYLKTGEFALYTNSKIETIQKQATLVLTFDQTEGEDAHRESFYFFFTEKEDGTFYLNLSQQTKVEKYYLFQHK